MWSVNSFLTLKNDCFLDFMRGGNFFWPLKYDKNLKVCFTRFCSVKAKLTFYDIIRMWLLKCLLVFCFNALSAISDTTTCMVCVKKFYFFTLCFWENITKIFHKQKALSYLYLCVLMLYLW